MLASGSLSRAAAWSLVTSEFEGHFPSDRNADCAF